MHIGSVINCVNEKIWQDWKLENWVRFIFVYVCHIVPSTCVWLATSTEVWIVASSSRFGIGCGRWGCHCRCHTCFENWRHIFISAKANNKSVYACVRSGVIAFPKFPNKLLQITKPFIHSFTHLSAKPLTLASRSESAMPNNYIRWHFCLFIIWKHERIIP